MSLERINPFQGKFQRKISISYIEAWVNKELEEVEKGTKRQRNTDGYKEGLDSDFATETARKQARPRTQYLGCGGAAPPRHHCPIEKKCHTRNVFVFL